MSISIVNSLKLPHQEDNTLLDKTLKGSLRRKGRLRESPLYDKQLTAWTAPLYTLDQSSLFLAQSPDTQQHIVQACNDFVMSESYFIEKAGIAYCAKMISMGETTEIRQMYGLIASDEAAHLSWLAPYLSMEQRISPQGKFVQHISGMIERCDTNTLYFLIQTVLEGWGIAYYKTLAKTCQWNCLKETLLDIVKDEAIHHNAGVALFDPSRMTCLAEIEIYDGMKSYLDILRVGAQNIVACVDKIIGPLSLSELTTLFQAIEAQSSSLVKLQIMKKIMQQPATQKWLDVLEDDGYFEPYSPEACANIYKSQIDCPIGVTDSSPA